MPNAPLMTIADIRSQLIVAQELAKIQQAFIVVPVLSATQLVSAASMSVDRFGLLERLAMLELEAERNERQ